MTLLQLQYFKTLAHVLHYTQAAAELEADAAFYRDCAREHAAQPLLPAD